MNDNKNLKRVLSRHLCKHHLSRSNKCLAKLQWIKGDPVHIYPDCLLYLQTTKTCIQRQLNNNNDNNLAIYFFKLLSQAFFIWASHHPCEVAKTSPSPFYEWRCWGWTSPEPLLLPQLPYGSSDFALLTPVCQAGQIQVPWHAKLYTTWNGFFKEKNAKSLL